MHHLYENPGPVRTYGNPEYCVALIHGGPGAPGEMKPVCQELAARGISALEPLQSATSIDGQIDELCTQIEKYATNPICLVGYSWGAILALLTAAEYPHLVRRVILVSSAVFEEKYAASIMEKRFQRLSASEGEELKKIVRALNKGLSQKTVEKSLNRFHGLIRKADSFDPIIPANAIQEFQPDLYKSVWTEAVSLRKSGELLNRISQFSGPIAAIHGDYDPHPIEGVEIPLKRVFTHFTVMELPKCGHTPWIERTASKSFYNTLIREIKK